MARRQSILGDNLDFKRSCWEGISPEARDFVAQLLAKDPVARPSAKQALQHPWLRGSARERSVGRQLSLAVVQRIQARRYVSPAGDFSSAMPSQSLHAQKQNVVALRLCI